MAINNFSYNPKTRTTESGTYYAGKNKADSRYASELTRSTSPYTAQGVANRQAQAKGGGAGIGGLQKLTKIGGGVNGQSSFLQTAEDAATTAVESELQDEVAAANANQAARTAEFAQQQANATRPPGGSVRRGTTTIGQASGSGLELANMEARRKAKLAAAKAKARLAVAETAMSRNNNLYLG